MPTRGRLSSNGMIGPAPYVRPVLEGRPHHGDSDCLQNRLDTAERTAAINERRGFCPSLGFPLAAEATVVTRSRKKLPAPWGD